MSEVKEIEELLKAYKQVAMKGAFVIAEFLKLGFSWQSPAIQEAERITQNELADIEKGIFFKIHTMLTNSIDVSMRIGRPGDPLYDFCKRN